MNFFWKSS